ncbi:MAG: hypothetical protein ACI8QZ_000297 [Chlamydiales bacterium]|jgi:hypothetical protein
MILRRTFMAFMLAAAYRHRSKRRLQLDAPPMDEALEMLAPFGPTFSGGLSNHGPMVAEALVAMGREDAVVAWIDRYRTRLEASPPARERIDAANWRQALGDGSRTGSWTAFFTNELAEAPWRVVVGRWVPRLAPGIAAAGTHAAIRTGHAACSLEVRETPERLDELARGLGYWAADYMELRGKPSGAGDLSPTEALAQVEVLPTAQRTGGGLITSEMKALNSFEPFEAAIDLVDPSLGSPDFLAELLATFAGVYLNTESSSFVFLHAVTGAASIRELLPFVPEKDRADVLAYTWQVNAGIFARYAQPGLTADLVGPPTTSSPEEIAERAVASGDAHTIKLAAACTREFRRNPDPRLMTAADSRAS